MKRKIKILLFTSLIILLTSCSNGLQNNYSNVWIGNWYGYIGDSFYKLTFDADTAGLYYESSYGGYRLLYKTEKYEATSKSFTVTFTKTNDGKALDRNMEIYGTLISGRDNGFLLWNAADRPFFRLD